MKNQEKTLNKTTIKADKIEHYAFISKKTLFDFRLTDKEAIALIRLLSLSDNFYISQRATAKYLHISEKSIERIFNSLKNLGYLDIIKNGNKYTYQIRQESKYINDFAPHLIETYTPQQLNALLNNSETPTKYKNLIKKYFDALSQDTTTYENILSEIKHFEMPKDILKEQQEQEREQDIIAYLKGK